MSDPVVYTEEFNAKAKELAKLGRILVYGKFDEKMESAVSEYIAIAAASLHSQNKQWATLHIDSTGGSRGVWCAIRVAMLESGLKFRGLVEYNALSAGFILLQYCSWRVAYTNSKLLFHFGDNSVHLNNEQQARLMLGEETRISMIFQENMEQLNRVSERSGISVNDLILLARKDTHILADEALKLGFLDEIITNPVSEKPPEGVFSLKQG